LIYSGCSNQMICNNALISNINTCFTYLNSLGDAHHVKGSRKGIVSVLYKQNEVKTIYDVYYVPAIKHNLLGVGKLLEHGYEVIFHDTICTIFDQLSNTNLVSKVN
jgi:hypothetical protein